MPLTQEKTVLSLRGITKQFPGVLANDDISFDLLEGEVHTILGENGAGKSTLMSIIDGIYQPDEGSISLYGEKINFSNPRDSIDHGIGMVFQHFMLIPNHSVAENITLGLKGLGRILRMSRKTFMKFVSVTISMLIQIRKYENYL